MANLAIIPARGGSKRILRKNIKDFLGKPIIAYSIEAALASGCFDEVMVSTDDPEIAEIALKYGAKVPFMRSAETSDDFSTMIDVSLEVLQKYKEDDRHFSHFCLIFATTPLIKPEYLAESYALLSEEEGESIISVTDFSFPIQRALKTIDGILKPEWPEHATVRSQDLEPRYHDAGSFLWIKTSVFMEQKSFYATKMLPYILPRTMVVDIDTLEDWQIAEMQYRASNNLKE